MKCWHLVLPERFGTNTMVLRYNHLVLPAEAISSGTTVPHRDAARTSCQIWRRGTSSIDPLTIYQNEMQCRMSKQIEVMSEKVSALIVLVEGEDAKLDSMTTTKRDVASRQIS